MTVRWALAGLLSAVALAACGSDEATQEEPQAAGPGTTTTEAGLPEGWTLCSNERAGYAIGYPADWYTATLDGEFECSFFDPEPFEIIPESEFPFTALQAFPAGEEDRTFDQVVAEYTDPMFERELAREETAVAGFPAVRLELEATGQGLYDEGTKTIVYVVDRDFAPFVVRAQIVPGADEASITEVLEQAVQTVRFFEPAGAETDVSELPPAVEQTRLAIKKAAENGDLEAPALEALIPAKGFTYTFGGPFPGGPTAYWQQIEEESPQRPLEALAAILEMPYTKVDDIYVWPFAYDRDPATLTEAERALLSEVAGEAEIRQWTEFGHYLGWRAGIKEDGNWVFFVAGD
ncbi:MAG: hypothetical protein WD027_02595 [Gaiellales bacterium]